jgi:hypothetical protein
MIDYLESEGIISKTGVCLIKSHTEKDAEIEEEE